MQRDDPEVNRVARLIFCSQTDGYARKRASALHELGRRYSCACYPEIMCAFVYGTDDADERVRYRAVREIARQADKAPGCCTEQVVAALSSALADEDKPVARAAERALVRFGYDVQSGVFETTAACEPDANQSPPAAPAEPPPASPLLEPAPLTPPDPFTSAIPEASAPAEEFPPPPDDILPLTGSGEAAGEYETAPDLMPLAVPNELNDAALPQEFPARDGARRSGDVPSNPVACHKVPRTSRLTARR